MIITFVGHSNISDGRRLLEKIKNTIEENIKDSEFVTFYCGGYGDFDNLCAKACRSIKKTHKGCELVFVTPYITESQQEKIEYFTKMNLYDFCVYPPLEKVPLRFAIIKRNEWMVREADLIIAYVNKSGGAYKTLEYARKRKKQIINLA